MRDIVDVVIEDGITSISEEAFCCSYMKTRLKSVTIPTSVTKIGTRAFMDCESLTSVTIPNSVTEIGNYAFEGCKKLTSVTIPDSVTKIGASAFDYCESLSSVTIPDSVTEIRISTFKHCKSLSSVTIPNFVTIIEYYAFYRCDALKSIIIPDSVKTIEEYAFCNPGLRSVTISGKDTKIAGNAFSNCPSAVFTVHPDHYQYMSKDGKLKMKPEYRIKHSTHEADGWKYYMDDDGKTIYKARPDASEITLVAKLNFYPGGFGIKDGWIYIFREDVEERIYSPANRDGTETGLSITYRMTLDGKGLQEVSREKFIR